MSKYPEDLQIITLDKCDSTNNYIKRNFDSLQHQLPLLVTSTLQTAGRGREQRNWISPLGKGLYSSFGFTLKNTPSLNLLPLAAGIAAIELLHGFTHLQFSLKWPNDILFFGKKIAGILIENIISEDNIFCIAGFGINLNQKFEDFPIELRDKATSLTIITGKTFEIEALNIKLASTLGEWLGKLKENAREEIIATANSYSQSLINKTISFHLPSNNKIISGIFKGINYDAGLILEKKSGNSTIFYSGEIVQPVYSS